MEHQPQAIIILNEIVHKINDNSLQLASLPDIIVRINDVLNDDRKGMADVANVVQHDMSLTARIIQIANSPALRGNSGVTNLTEAINRLGVTLVKNLAICVSFKDKMSGKHSPYSDLIEDNLKSSLRASVVGCVLAKDINESMASTMLIAGLVGRIGNIVTLRYISESANHRHLSIDAAKGIVEIIGSSVTELVLRMWEFPEAIRIAVTSTDMADCISPETMHDIYTLTNLFVDGKLSVDLSLRTQETLDTYYDEVQSLELLFK